MNISPFTMNTFLYSRHDDQAPGTCPMAFVVLTVVVGKYAMKTVVLVVGTCLTTCTSGYSIFTDVKIKTMIIIIVTSIKITV